MRSADDRAHHRVPASPFAVLLLVVGVLAIGGGPAGATEEEPARATLVADTTAFEPGSTFRLGVRFTIDEHWHIYWHSARDGGLPTTIAWQLPEGWTAGPITWPVPRRFVDPGDLVSYGYEHEVLLASTITVPEGYEGTDPVKLAADVSWLVCKVQCLIGEAKPTLALPRGEPAPSKEAPRFSASEKKAPRSPEAMGIVVDERFVRDGSSGTWTLSWTWPEGPIPARTEIRAFPFDPPGGRLDEGRVVTPGRRTVFTFQVSIDNDQFRPEALGAVLTWPVGQQEEAATDGKGAAKEPDGKKSVKSEPVRRALRVVHRPAETAGSSGGAAPGRR